MDKRGRLIDAAVRVVHAQGYGRTTLADIAAAADVPLGNVYYYFKTKEAIGEALISAHTQHYDQLKAEWDLAGGPRERLLAFIGMTTENQDVLARHGCPVGTLCAEVGKSGGVLAERAAAIFIGLLAWLADQFRALGHAGDADDLALHLLSAIQGASLIAHGFGDTAPLLRETSRLVAWITDL